jgi:hypothetical protein
MTKILLKASSDAASVNGTLALTRNGNVKATPSQGTRMDIVTTRDDRWRATLSGFKNIIGLLTMIALRVILASPTASAQETPILVARNVPQITGWCGHRAVYFNRGNDSQILDVFSKKRVRLQFDRSEYHVSQCSPNSRWVITVQLGTRAEQAADEEDRESCYTQEERKPTRIVLWDMQQGSRRDVGRGYVDFNWSPDGKIVLYRFIPMCGYESYPTNSIKFPAMGRNFVAVSTLAMISNSIVPSSGWPNQGRIGETGWYAPDAFVVQLPVNEGSPGTFHTPDGAILSIHLRDGKLSTVEQLNPSGFESSWQLALPQLSPTASDEILKAAHCTADPPANGWRSSMHCTGPDEIEGVGFRPSPAYCAALKVGDARQFCSPVPPKEEWRRFVRGSTVLVVKSAGLSGSEKRRPKGADLFRIDHDHRGYLK